jgi:hypothetical protein
MIAVASFVTANLAIDSLATLGPTSCYYYYTGGFALCASYFISYYCRFNYNDTQFENASGKRRNLVTKENGSIDWYLLGCYAIGALL